MPVQSQLTVDLVFNSANKYGLANKEQYNLV